MKVHYGEIDGLRALAITLVFINHLWPELLRNGYLGVDIFFVISGFVISRLLISHVDLDFGKFLSNFYSARLKRLLPVLLIVVLVTSLAISLFSPDSDSFLKTGVFAVFGLANISLYAQSQDYFSRAAELNPFTHMWSLGVEEQFYFVLPVMLWLLVRKFGQRVFAFVLSVAVVASIVLYIVMLGIDGAFAFYMIPTRFWQLGLGVLVYLYTERWAALAEKQERSLLFGHAKHAALAALVLLVLFPIDFVKPALPLIVCVLTAIILAAIVTNRQNSILLSGKIPVHVGKLSYSIYLWHWPVIVLLRWTYGFDLAAAIFAVLVTYLLALLSFSYIEMPLRYSTWSRHKVKEIGIALISAGMVAGLLAAQVKFLNINMYLGQPLINANLAVSLTKNYVSPTGTTWLGDDCVLASNSDVGASIAFEDCTIGAKPADADMRVLVLGNSFSAAMVAMYDLTEVADKKVSVIATSSWGASPIGGMANDGAWNLANDYYWNDLAPSLVGQLRPGDKVFLVNDIASLSPDVSSADNAEKLALFEKGIVEFSAFLSERKIGFVVLGPLPFLRESKCDPSAASPQWFAPNGAACIYYSREETLARQAPLRNMLTNLEEKGVLKVVDLMPLFCADPECRFFNGEGVLLYRDEYSHPTIEISVSARSYLARTLE